MPSKSARMRSGGIRPSSAKSQAACLPPTLAASDTVFDFLAMIPSPVTFPPSPPKSAHMHSGGILPSSAKSQAACLPPVSTASDPAFNFLAMIPSPVAFPPSWQALSGAGTVASMDSLSLAQAVPHPSVDDGDDVIPVTVGLHSYADTLDCIASFLTPPHRSPCTIRSQVWSVYDMILSLVCVRYDLPALSCMIWSLGSFLYDINLGATATTILRIRGVQIPIDLVSSATDSYRRSVVLFKPMSVLTSDPKSEFLYQLSSIVHDLQTPPWTTLYAWDISHVPVITYHLYCHSLSALTEYLKQKLRLQRAKRLGHSLPAQVEPSVQLERNNPLSSIIAPFAWMPAHQHSSSFCVQHIFCLASFSLSISISNTSTSYGSWRFYDLILGKDASTNHRFPNTLESECR